MASHYQVTYAWIRRHITLVLFLVLGIPFIVACSIIYIYGYRYIESSVIEQAKGRLSETALEVRSEIDFRMFDLIRTLSTIPQQVSLSELQDEAVLKQIFARLEKESDEVFQDLAVVAFDGSTLSWTGSYDLEQADYSSEEWFFRACTDQTLVSDVNPDFRMNPFFIVTARHDRCDEPAVLRASISGFWLSSYVDTIRIGRTGEAFIVNSNGVTQTRSRLGKRFGEPLEAPLLYPLQGDGVHKTVISDNGVYLLAAITALKSNPEWHVVVCQEKFEAIEDIYRVRLVFFLAFILGFFSIGLICLISSRLVVRKIRQKDEKKSILDEQLIQSHKLAAIGQLSSGVAHEINNPLAIIGEEAGWLQDILNKDDVRGFKHRDEFYDSLTAIDQQIRRCKEITHKLLSFARRMESNIREVDLNEVVEEVISLREKDAFLNNIKIKRDYKDLPVFYSEPSLLRQMFLNLINNALDSVEKDGTVSISTDRMGDDWLMIKIIDDGVGISRDNLGKIFDPFFTTKPPGKGSGLGLSICHGIVSKLGGEIAVESVLGKGTTVTVTLPLEPPEKIKPEADELDDAGIVLGKS